LYLTFLDNNEVSLPCQYQGRDKECIIVSLVRANDKGLVGDLLTDWRRINVAITRAKHKLVFFGSASTLSVSANIGLVLNVTG
jgi:DNA replication ATP-dependent helicase Dna2